MKLKNVLKNLFAWINSFWSKLDKETKKFIPIAISLTNGVKQFVDSPVGDFTLDAIKGLIKGSVDDVLIDKIHAFIDDKLPEVILKLKLIYSIAEIEDKEAKIQVILNTLKEADISEKTNFYIGLSAVVLETLKDGKITMAEATLLIQSYYHGKIQETV